MRVATASRRIGRGGFRGAVDDGRVQVQPLHHRKPGFGASRERCRAGFQIQRISSAQVLTQTFWFGLSRKSLNGRSFCALRSATRLSYWPLARISHSTHSWRPCRFRIVLTWRLSGHAIPKPPEPVQIVVAKRERHEFGREVLIGDGAQLTTSTPAGGNAL
jgi:hypothetical protein